MTQEEFLKEWNEGNGSLTAHTSGSTGTPKRIVLPESVVLASARRTNVFFGITTGSRLHVPLDFDYIAAKMMGVRAAVSGAQLTSEVPSNRPMSHSRFTSSDVIDLLAVVPSQMEYIIDHLDSLPKLCAVIIGGGIISDHIKEGILRSGLNAWETYGMTETASHIALRRVGEEWFETLDGIEISLTPEGCLRIRVENIQDLDTNDLSELKDSRHFRIIGRADNVINTGGKKVAPEEVERKLSTIWNDFDFAITSAPDDKWGERIVAVVAPNPNSASASGEANGYSGKYFTDGESVRPSIEDLARPLISDAKSILPSHMVPKEIRFTDHIPRTTNGKIDRRALKKT